MRPLSPHSTRHTFASLALDSGMSIRFVADQLGHSSAAFTLEIYAHLLPVKVGDMGFAEFGRPPGVTIRHQRKPTPIRKNPRSPQATGLQQESWSARPGSNRRPSAWEAG